MSKKYTAEEYAAYIQSVHGDDFELLSPYAGAFTPVKVTHKKCGFTFVTNPRMGKAIVCSWCDKRRLTENIFQHNWKSKWPDDYELLSEYESYNKPLKVKHVSCGHIFKQRGDYILSNGPKCSRCGNYRKLSLEEMNERLKQEIPDRYQLVEEIMSVDDKTTFICLDCNKTFDNYFNNIIKGKSHCPHCSRDYKQSHKVKYIKNILNELGVSYVCEYKDERLKNKKCLKFDFFLPEYDAFIEYDGEQHFKQWTHGGEIKTTTDILYIRSHDCMKDIFCKDNRYSMLRLSFKKSYSNVKRAIESYINILKTGNIYQRFGRYSEEERSSAELKYKSCA